MTRAELLRQIRRQFRRYGVAVGLSALLCLLASLLVWMQWQDAQRQAEDSVLNAARVLAGETQKSFDAADALLQSAMRRYRAASARGERAQEELRSQLEAEVGAYSVVERVAIASRDGEVVFNSAYRADAGKPPILIADRDYFQRLREGESGPVFAGPMISRADNQWVMILARRMEDGNGQFAGVGLTVMTVAAIGRELSDVDLGRRGVINLRTDDFAQVIRIPELEGPGTGIGNRNVSQTIRDLMREAPGQPSYVYRTVAPIDGVERVYAYWRFSHSPFWMTVGRASGDFAANWRLAALYLALLVAAGIALLFWRTGQQLQRQAALAEALARKTQSESELEARVRARTRDLEREKQALRDSQTELEAARSMAEAANQAKSHFLATLSHELRTPLNALVGTIHLLRLSQPTARQAGHVELLSATAQTLLGLLNDILDLSKIEAGELLIEEADFDLPVLIGEIRQLFSNAAAARGLDFALVADPACLPGRVRGDALRLRQVLQNLLSNAIKFTRQGGVTLAVDCLEQGEAGYRLRFRVTDTGIGIAPEAQSRIFRPFTQSEPSHSRQFGGTGLGLSIVDQLVALMGGQIHLASQPGIGSRFEVILPFAPAETPALPAGESTADLPPGQRLQGLHVLLVDDQPDNLDVAIHLLAHEGARVSTCVDGQDALDWLATQRQRPDIVLMDVQMPVMDGNAAVRAIRANPVLADLPVVAVSAGALQAEREASLAAGMNDYVAKPFDPERIIAIIRRLTSAPAAPPGPLSLPLPGPLPAPVDLASAGQLPGTASASLPPATPEPAEEWPLIPGIELAQVRRNLVDDRALYLDLLQRFLDDATPDQALASLAAGNSSAAARALHKLAGTAGNLAARGLASAAKALEHRLLGGELVGQDDFAGLLRHHAALQAAVAAALDGLRPVDAGPTSATSLPVDLGEQLSRLDGYLADNQFDACQLARDIDASLVADTGLRNGFSPCLQAVGELDFAGARLLLAAFLRQHRSRIDPPTP